MADRLQDHAVRFATNNHLVNMLCLLLVFCSTILTWDVAPEFDGAVARRDNLIFAHSTLDGQYFYEIKPGDMLRLYDQEWIDYRVTDILRLQALPPHSLTPQLVAGRPYTYREIFGHDLVLQTCITQDGNPEWGRLFVLAEKWKP